MQLHTGGTGAVRESALQFDWEKNPCRTGESNLRQRRPGPLLYQLSYIPTPFCGQTVMVGYRDNSRENNNLFRHRFELFKYITSEQVAV